jgi:hypothetical protein
LTLALAQTRDGRRRNRAGPVSFSPGRDSDKKPGERNERRRQPDTACQRPPPARVSPCAESGAYRAADERRRQVDAVEPSARFWGERENGPIAEDEIGLHPEDG